MAQMIFVNLPVTDLARSIAFYEGIGAVQDRRFSDESGAMVSFSDEVKVMLLTHHRFADFTPKAVPDTARFAQVLLALSRDNQEHVDATVGQAARLGATLDPTPPQDYGWMYGRSFEDPDGHIWELSWMDVEAAIAATAQRQQA